MVKSRNHSVIIVKANKLKGGRMSIGVKGRFGVEKLGEFSTGVIIQEDHWDSDENFIKYKKRDLYKREYKKLLGIRERCEEVRDKLAEGAMHWSSAEDYIMNRGKELEDEAVLDYIMNIDPSRERQYSTLKKHIMNVRAVQNKLLDQKYNPLMFSHLNDVGIVRHIHQAIMNSSNKSNYKRQQLQSIQLMWRKKNDYKSDRKLFDSIPQEVSNPKPKTPVTNNKFMDALERLHKPTSTIQQFEALLFWLYSLSLTGLDGVDLINLDENDIVEDMSKVRFGFYHPDFDRFFPEKLHVQVIRTKSRMKDNDDYVKITRLWNLFPSMYLKMLLGHITYRTRPDVAYKGDDKLKLFNFYTRDKKTRMQIPEGVDKWNALRYQYTHLLNKTLGASVQFTRSTSAKLASDLDISASSIDSFLGHSNRASNETSKSLKHYMPSNQLRVDIDHIFILQEFDIVGKIRTIYEMFKDRESIVNNKRVKWIPETYSPMPSTDVVDVFENTNKLEAVRWTFNQMYFPLSKWSKGEENEFQTYHLKYSEKVKVWDNKKKKMVEKEYTPADYDDRFKELLQRKYGKQDKDLDKVYKLYQKEKANLNKVYELVNA